MNITAIKITRQLALSVGVGGLALLTGGGPASATDEFPPNPSVEISITCSAAKVGDVLVIYKNDGGLSDAEFDTVIDGMQQPHISLDAAIWTHIHYPLPEGSPGVVVITAPGMNTVTTTLGPVDCIDDVTTTVPETTIPESTVPDSSVPESTVPDDGVPQTTIPDDGVPETTMPDDSVPEPNPVTTVPAPTTTVALADVPTAPTVVVGGPDPVQLPQTGNVIVPTVWLAVCFVATGLLLSRSGASPD